MEELSKAEKIRNHQEGQKTLSISLERINTGKILACVGPRELYPENDRKKLSNTLLTAERVNYNGTLSEWSDNNQRNGGRAESYVISSISSQDKYSSGYHNCTGIAAIGVDVKTGENISILSHQDPCFIHATSERWERFLSDVRKVFTELKSRSKDDSVDIVLFAGDYSPGNLVRSIVKKRAKDGKSRNDDYKDAIKGIAHVSQEVLGIDPRVIVGPKAIGSGIEVDVVLDTQHRRLYLYRPLQDSSNKDHDFNASNVESHVDHLTKP